MGIVAFNVDTFRARYPEFSKVSDNLLALYFAESTLYLNNTECSAAKDVGQREMLLYMLTAHLTYLGSGDDSGGGGSAGGVGRVASASEGSVSVSFDMGPTTQSNAWYYQSKYGAKYWNATAQYRTMHYRPGFSPSGYPNIYSPRRLNGWR